MSDNIFNSDWYKAFNQITMDDFLKMTGRFKEFGLTREEIIDGIRSACAFFNIPMPRMIQDLTNVQGGQTMFVNWDAGRYDDDVLCFNMRQLVDMKVNSKDAFSLVMTHECAHRVLQATRFPGMNNGIWENERSMEYGYIGSKHRFANDLRKSDTSGRCLEGNVHTLREVQGGRTP